MLSHRSIGFKLRVGVGLLAASTVALFCAALYGLYAYRGLAKTLSARSAELPLAQALYRHAADLHLVLGQARERAASLIVNEPDYALFPNDYDEGASPTPVELRFLLQEYDDNFDRLEEALEGYRSQLDANQATDGSRIGGAAPERETLAQIDAVLEGFRGGGKRQFSPFYEDLKQTDQLEEEIGKLRELAELLPSHLHNRLGELAGEVRSQYHVAIGLAWATFVSAIVLLAVAMQVFRAAIAHPIESLVGAARKVAAGDFAHRVSLHSRDEMGELADAMNSMMANFQHTRDDLDRQVRERTGQVIRSEQLASVGFLAAGVAHEINNPLAAIAMCSESLESRVADLEGDDPARAAEWDIVRSYLETIGKESFRCKQITEKLLDFARMGDRQRRPTDLRELVSGVVQMVSHMGVYRQKEAVLLPGESVIAEVDAQEIKQVVLNLVTNGMESLDEGGQVKVAIERSGAGAAGKARIVVSDNGCGMTDEVKQHLFEPFFTRRRSGQGTGLGLSITYRIIEEHHGELTADSEGAGRGSVFTITLPTEQPVAQQAA